jgi:hypothetical protein
MKLHPRLVIVGLLSLGFLSYSCANGDTVSGTTGNGTGNGGSNSTGTGGSSSTGTGGNSTGTGGTHTGGTTGAGGTHTGGSTGTGGIIAGGTGGTHTGGTTGTGGIVTTGTGGTVVTGTGGTTTASCGNAFAVGINGYVTMPAVGGGCWTGFASDGGDAGSTIMPGTFSTCGAGCMLTMTGTLNASNAANSYAGYSYLGFNIAQDSGGAITTVAPKGSGVTVTFTNTSSAPVVRVALNADAAGATSWCAPATTSPATILYSAFTQQCYNPTPGPAYMKQPIISVQLSVPGGTASGPVNVTLVSVKENP